MPGLTTDEKLRYLSQEFEELQEMLECADDCKWIYQSLIHISIIYKKLANRLPPQANNGIDWISKLMDLDSLRSGRWVELRRSLYPGRTLQDNPV